MLENVRWNDSTTMSCFFGINYYLKLKSKIDLNAVFNMLFYYFSIVGVSGAS